jgi:hypothetical protein
MKKTRIKIKKNKTWFVWFTLIVVALNLFSGLINLGISYFRVGLANPLFLITLSHVVLSTAIGIIFISKVHKLSKDVFLWTNILFLYVLIANLAIALLIFYLNKFDFSNQNLFYNLLYEIARFVIVVIFWIIFYLHLKHAKKKHLMEFD